MKLFTKYNRVNLFATIVIFLLSVTAFYFAIRFILIDQVDNDLKIEQREIETLCEEHNTLPESISVKDQKISYALSGDHFRKRRFTTITIKGERDSFRILQFGITVKKTTWRQSLNL
jgi:hypothetical protein